MTFGRKTEQPVGSLQSVDKSSGSPSRSFSILHVLIPHDHGALGPVDHLELLVLSCGLHVYSTKTPVCVTVKMVEYIVYPFHFVRQTTVLVFIH